MLMVVVVVCRPLRLLSMQPMVVKPSRMRILTGCDVPSDLYPHLLTEAILQRSLQVRSHMLALTSVRTGRV